MRYSNDSFYKTKRWEKKREIILKRDEYGCKECSRYGNTIPATTVHHIYPLETHPEFRLTNENLVSLCNNCHERMHNRITNELTELGKSWQSRIYIKSKL